MTGLKRGSVKLLSHQRKAKMHRMPAERSICMEKASGYIEKQRDANKYKEHCL